VPGRPDRRSPRDAGPGGRRRGRARGRGARGRGGPAAALGEPGGDMHAIAPLVAGALLAAACNSKTPQASGGSALGRPNETGSSTMTTLPDAPPPTPTAPPRTALEQVQRWAPAGHTVGPEALAVPGLELFRVSPPVAGIPADGARPYSIVAVAGGVVGK